MEDFSNPRSSASACLKGVAGSDETDQGGVLRREAMSSRRDDDEAGDDSDDDSVSGGGGEGKTEGGCTGSSCNTGGGGGGNVDKLATIRREKRLAMNRESARNRRKRKKVLIQTLEVQLDEVSRSNQQYKLANESLSAKVRALENELAVARDTIGQLTSAAAAAATVTGNHAHLQQRFGAHNHPGAASASLAPSHNDNNFDFGEHHQFRHGTASTVADVQHRGDSLGRLMQAQLDHYALQTGGTSGIPFASGAASGAGGGSQFTDDSILRRHAIELQALSQASQNSATLGSMVNVSRFAPNAMGERNHQSLGIPGSPLGINPCPEVFHSMRAPPQDFGLGDRSRFQLDLAGSGAAASQNLRVFDAFAQSRGGGGVSGGGGVASQQQQQQVLEELIGQRHNEELLRLQHQQQRNKEG